MNKKQIYLDNSATTPLDPAVMEAMKPYFMADFGNPGSLHSFGLAAKQALDDSRKTVASFVGCKPEEIVFTSGGTESDNLAIRGVIKSERARGREKLHIITTAIEHKAVLDTIKSLEKAGEIEATYIKPQTDGVIRVEDIKAAIRENTILISVMYVNNEIGTIQPIREIGKLIADRNSKIYFHTDAVQAIEYCPINVADLGVDLMSVSAHKIYGPKGVGFLYVKRGTPLMPELIGGGQERGLRAGTENVPGIVGMAKALELVKSYKVTKLQNKHISSSPPSSAKVTDGTQPSHSSEYPRPHEGEGDLEVPSPRGSGRGEGQGEGCSERICTLRDRLIDGLLSKIPDAILNGKREDLAPHIANISFVNAEGEAILLNLDFLGIAVSTGSACTSRTLEPSHVLSAMGVPPEKAHGSVRFSLGHKTTEAEIDRVIEVLPGIIAKLRAMSPLK